MKRKGKVWGVAPVADSDAVVCRKLQAEEEGSKRPPPRYPRFLDAGPVLSIAASALGGRTQTAKVITAYRSSTPFAMSGQIRDEGLTNIAATVRKVLKAYVKIIILFQYQ